MTIKEVDSVVKDMRGDIKFHTEEYILYTINYQTFTAKYSGKTLKYIKSYNSMSEAVDKIETIWEQENGGD